jgi:hypothetical protein
VTVPASLPGPTVRVCAVRVTPDLAMFLGVTAPLPSPALAIVGGPNITIAPMLGRQEGTAQITLHAGPDGSGNTLAVQNFGSLGDPLVPCPTLSTRGEAVHSVTVSSSHSSWVFMLSSAQ